MVERVVRTIVRRFPTQILSPLCGGLLVTALLSCVAPSPEQTGPQAEPFSRTVPKAWDDDLLVSMHVPLADPTVPVEHMSARRYYELPVRVIYETYPIYHPDREPPGYIDDLKQREPKIKEFDVAQFTSEQDWIDYGAQVFQLPTGTDSEPFSALFTFDQTRDREWYKKIPVRIESRTGIMPYGRYIIREKGKIEVGTLSCAMCHTRVMDDGSTILGAQGNYAFDRSGAQLLRDAAPLFATEAEALKEFRAFDTLLFGIPWRTSDPLSRLGTVSLETYIGIYEAIPPGVLARNGTSPVSPVQIPDLIGVQQRKFLDRTGLIRHREIGDLMRYAALNQAAELMTSYGDFIPGGENMRDVPGSQRSRFSDEQLFALAKYIYSLQPPDNPHRPRTQQQRKIVANGKAVFERLHCGFCHRSPLYTSNRLSPVDGFEVPSDHLRTYGVTEFSLGTDPVLTLETRRGTGYYKIPSLLGVWYRGPFEHNGSVATLEDWFDPRRLSDDYLPTGWKGPPGTERRAVKGHPFGLNLPLEDRQALIAFLRTL